MERFFSFFAGVSALVNVGQIGFDLQQAPYMQILTNPNFPRKKAFKWPRPPVE